MTVKVWSFNRQKSFLVIRSRDWLVWSLNMSNKAMQARVMLLQSNDSQIFIILLIKFDCSSKLCFEEKSNNAIGDKIFKRVNN